MGEATEKIEAKETFHLLDAVRYVVPYLHMDKPRGGFRQSRGAAGVAESLTTVEHEVDPADRASRSSSVSRSMSDLTLSAGCFLISCAPVAGIITPNAAKSL